MMRDSKTGCFGLLLVVISFAGISQSRAQSLKLSTGPTHLSSCMEAQVLLQRGKEMMRAKNYKGAITQFQSALTFCSDDEDAALELIEAYLSARDFPSAESAAKSFLAEHRRSEPAQYFLAYGYFMEQKFQYAGQTLQKLLAQDNKNPDALRLMGLTLFFYKEYVLAEQELRAALATRPNDEETLYALGRVYQTQNDFPPAIKVFEELVARDPKNYRAYDNLAVCYADIRKTSEADATFTKAEQVASEVNPSDDWPFANHANMLIKYGQTDAALRCIKKAIQIDPRSARNQFILGKVLIGKNDLADAAKHLSLSIQLDNRFAKSHYLLGRVYEKMHEPKRAQQEFAKFKQLSERTETPGLESSNSQK